MYSLFSRFPIKVKRQACQGQPIVSTVLATVQTTSHSGALSRYDRVCGIKLRTSRRGTVSKYIERPRASEGPKKRNYIEASLLHQDSRPLRGPAFCARNTSTRAWCGIAPTARGTSYERPTVFAKNNCRTMYSLQKLHTNTKKYTKAMLHPAHTRARRSM